MARKNSRDKGFSLVEVNLAILVVALCMLTLLGAFPAALRQGETAVSETQTAMFADYVLSTIRVNTRSMTNWNQWKTMASFNTCCVSNLYSDAPARTPIVNRTDVSPCITFSGQPIRYILEISGLPNAPSRQIMLWAWNGAYVTTDPLRFKDLTKLYYTEVYFQGGLP